LEVQARIHLTIITTAAIQVVRITADLTAAGIIAAVEIAVAAVAGIIDYEIRPLA